MMIIFIMSHCTAWRLPSLTVTRTTIEEENTVSDRRVQHIKIDKDRCRPDPTNGRTLLRTLGRARAHTHKRCVCNAAPSSLLPSPARRHYSKKKKEKIDGRRRRRRGSESINSRNLKVLLFFFDLHLSSLALFFTASD